MSLIFGNSCCLLVYHKKKEFNAQYLIGYPQLRFKIILQGYGLLNLLTHLARVETPSIASIPPPFANKHPSTYTYR
jgi:hypothetical protein